MHLFGVYILYVLSNSDDVTRTLLLILTMVTTEPQFDLPSNYTRWYPLLFPTKVIRRICACVSFVERNTIYTFWLLSVIPSKVPMQIFGHWVCPVVFTFVLPGLSVTCSKNFIISVFERVKHLRSTLTTVVIPELQNNCAERPSFQSMNLLYDL